MKTILNIKNLIALFIILGLSNISNAQIPTLVKDISLGSSSTIISKLVSANGQIFFSINNRIYGYELWKSDGTDAGTKIVKDIIPGISNGLSTTYTTLCAFKNEIYFYASEGINGFELWKSDGTENGTKLIKNISSRGSSNIEFFTPVGDILYFYASDDNYGKELWKTDGTEAGTILVKDITEGIGSTMIYQMYNANNTLYFLTKSGNETNLWKSDGTESGTVTVSSTNFSTSGGFNIINVDEKIFLSGGKNLYVSDGSENGTLHLATFDVTSNNLISCNGLLFIDGSDSLTGRELWISDGTINGTFLIKDIEGNYTSSDPDNFIVYNNELLFSTQNGIWKSNGTENGTFQITSVDFVSPTSSGQTKVIIDDNIYFKGSGPNGIELWKTDGSSVGTVEVMDINPGGINIHSNPENLINVNGTLFFTADDGVHGIELWKLDVVTTGIKMIHKNKINIYPNPFYDNVTIESDNNGIIKIINIQRQTIKTFNISKNKTTLNLFELSSGFYTLEIITEDRIVTNKLIKK